jgi:hypothetical protein
MFAPRKIAENSFVGTLAFREFGFPAAIERLCQTPGFTPTNRNLDCP